jgi:hypothetical protein
MNTVFKRVVLDDIDAAEIITNLAHYNSDYNSRMERKLKEWGIPTEYHNQKAFAAAISELSETQLTTLLQLVY